MLPQHSIDLTQEAINAARKWFADNALACAMAAHSRSDSAVLQNGEFYVNDLDNTERVSKDSQVNISLAPTITPLPSYRWPTTYKQVPASLCCLHTRRPL